MERLYLQKPDEKDKTFLKNFGQLSIVLDLVFDALVPMFRWDIGDFASCECKQTEQTAMRIINDCRILHPPSGTQDLKFPNRSLEESLHRLFSKI